MWSIQILLRVAGHALVCRYCFGDTWANCGSASITCIPGYEHCYAGYLHTGEDGKRVVYTRGCTACPNERTGCDVINSTIELYKPIRGCEIECCQDDKCNDMSPTQPPSALEARGAGTKMAVCAALLAVTSSFATIRNIRIG